MRAIPSLGRVILENTSDIVDQRKILTASGEDCKRFIKIIKYPKQVVKSLESLKLISNALERVLLSFTQTIKSIKIALKYEQP